MSRTMTITSNDGRVDIVQAPDDVAVDAGLNQGYQQGEGHPDEIEDVVSIGIAISTAEKLKEAKDELELMKILGIEEDQAREMLGQFQDHQQKLPGEQGNEDYMFDAVREVVIDMLTASLGNEDEIVVDYRLFETRVAEKIREKEADPRNREARTPQGQETDGIGGASGSSE